MRISDRMRGVVRLEIFGALPPALLNAAAAGGIALWRAKSADENTLRLCCWEGQLDALRALAERAGCEVTVLSKSGEPRAYSPDAGHTGYIPSALQTNHAEVCPLSSSPQ